MVTYRVVEAGSLKVLESMVNRLLNQGWKLHSSLVVQNNQFYQSLTKIHRKKEVV